MSVETLEKTDALPDAAAEDPPDDPSPRGPMVCGRFQIIGDRNLGEFDIPGARGYAAEDAKNPSRALIARVCEPGVYPRSDATLRLRMMGGVHVLQPIHSGPVAGSAGTETLFATIFDRPPDGRLMPSLDARIRPMAPEEIGRRVLVPAARTLAHFAQRGLTHRAVRPDNIFVSPGERELCLLGDCVSTPPGWGQPAFAEPIELMMCDRAARGAGGVADDLYALGATMLVLSIGFDPTRGLDDETLLKAKIESGSYTAILQGERAPRALRELLRGLLADDMEERWGFEDIDRWLSGTLRQSSPPARRFKAERAFAFAGEEFREARLLAHALARRWSEAPKAILSPPFDAWVKRSIGGSALAESVAGLLAATPRARRGPAQDAELVSRVCMALDSAGPLRFKGWSLMPDGIGTALGRALREGDQERVGVLHECIESGLVEQWFAIQRDCGRQETDAHARSFERIRKLARHKGPGYGIERCAYELDRNLPCLSAVLQGRQISDLHDLLPALEALVESQESLPTLIDRHLPAYIATHMTRNLDQHLGEIASATGSSPTAKLGMVRLLAEIQESFGPARLPHLTRWVAAEVRPLAMVFRSRRNRDRVMQQLDRCGEAGRLAAVIQLLGNQRFRQSDERGYESAVKQYGGITRQIAELASDDYRRQARRLGLSVAAGVSTTVAACVMIAVALY